VKSIGSSTLALLEASVKMRKHRRSYLPRLRAVGNQEHDAGRQRIVVSSQSHEAISFNGLVDLLHHISTDPSPSVRVFGEMQ
jgi:hypothetical protein